MARYIDADDLKAVINANDWSNPVVPDVVGIIIDRTPTADVVPKSEVERLSHKCDDCAGCTQWKCDCANIELEVAREFIEAIDPMLDLVCHMTGLEITFFGKYGELKKKYAEEKNEH